jgi:hypothetical protein
MRKRTFLAILIGVVFSIFTGCAPVMVSVSNPSVRTATNPYYEVKFEPLKQGLRSFVVFELTVTNKTDVELEIDWNQTRYLYNGRPNGLFVFRGIEPGAAQSRTIPTDVISPQDTFTRIIAPHKLLAYAPFREQLKQDPDEPAFSGGPIPAGESGILLVVKRKDQVIKEKLAVKITKVESEQ